MVTFWVSLFFAILGGFYIGALIAWGPVLNDPNYFIREEREELLDYLWFRGLLEKELPGTCPKHDTPPWDRLR